MNYKLYNPMVKDTVERASVSGGNAAADATENELYEQCFIRRPVEMKSNTIEPFPKESFARVLRQIDTMELKRRARVDLEMVPPRGYVFAIHLPGTDFVTIGYGGRVPLASTLKRLQVANPQTLEVIAVLQRYSFDDARAICEMIHSGMIMWQSKNKAWFVIDDCRRKVMAMFTRIDKIDNGVDNARPSLFRQSGYIS